MKGTVIGGESLFSSAVGLQNNLIKNFSNQIQTAEK